MNASYQNLLPSEWEYMSKVYAALGDDHRQRILLMFKTVKELNVGQISDMCPLTRSAVSHHLKLLHDAKILSRRKEGKEVYYSINKDTLVDTLQNTLDYVKNVQA